MRLVLDHHYPAAIGPLLRARGLDALHVSERGWDRSSDAELLQTCALDRRALLTTNVVDFMVLVRDMQIDRMSHSGLIFTSDRQWPRTHDTAGRFVDALAELMEERPEEHALEGLIVWLSITDPSVG